MKIERVEKKAESGETLYAYYLFYRGASTMPEMDDGSLMVSFRAAGASQTVRVDRLSKEEEKHHRAALAIRRAECADKSRCEICSEPLSPHSCPICAGRVMMGGVKDWA